MADGINIVTIKEVKPLYKKEEVANNIVLVTFEEFGFYCVTQKGRFNVGDKAIYIEPDYCVPDTQMFESFIRPNGDESKSYLGKINGKPARIRAKKFNFTLEPNGTDYVYSNGILLNTADVFGIELSDLGIYKYVEPEDSSNGPNVKGKVRPFPSGVYKTDETNILKFKDIKFPITLIGTEKVDGSSITIGITDEYPNGFICSRNLMKSIYINKVVGRKKKTLLQKLMFWKKFDLNIYETVFNEEDDFVKYGYPWLSYLRDKCAYNTILRGELCGKHLKGSGNTNNPHKDDDPHIEFFGVDYWDTQSKLAKKANIRDLNNLPGENCVHLFFNKEFNSFEELMIICKDIFDLLELTNKTIIEGIVVRTEDGSFSAKVMNQKYDSLK